MARIVSALPAFTTFLRAVKQSIDQYPGSFSVLREISGEK